MVARILVIFCLLLTGVSPALAGQAVIIPEPDFLLTPPTEVKKGFRLQLATGYVSEADFSNGLGAVSVARASLTADYSIFKLSYEASRFNWKDKASAARTLHSSETNVPWEYLHDVTLQARLLNDTFAKKWRYWVNGELASSFEQDCPGAIGAGFDGGMAYDFWDGWMIGVSGRTVALSALNKDLFGEMEFGIAIATSQRALRNTLQTLGLFTDADDGSESIGFSFAFSGASKTYRLAASNPIAQNGYLSLVRSKVGAYLDYKPSDDVTLSIGPEFHYNRKYKLYKSTGSFRSSHDLDSTLGGYARLLWKF